MIHMDNQTVSSNRPSSNDRFAGIRLGDSVTDMLTGFRGVVTAQVSYLTGCDQCLVLPKAESENKMSDAIWFDIERLKLVQSGAVTVKNVTPGGCDLPTPQKR